MNTSSGNFTEKGLLNPAQTTIKVSIKGTEVEILLADFIETVQANLPAEPVPGSYTLTRTLSAAEIATLGTGIILLPALTRFKYNVTSVVGTTSTGVVFTGATNITIIQDLAPLNSGSATWFRGNMIGAAGLVNQNFTLGVAQPTVATAVRIYTDAGGLNAPFANPGGAGTISLTLVINYSIVLL